MSLKTLLSTALSSLGSSMLPYAVIGAVAIAGGSFYAGYKVESWHNASLELVATNAANAAAKSVTNKFQGDQQNIAVNVQDTLSKWSASNPKIQKEITHEKLQPVFSNNCLTDTYVGLFNERTNSWSSTESEDNSSKSSAKVGN